MVKSRCTMLLRICPLLVIAMLLLLLGGCGPRPRVEVKPDFKPPAELETVYVIPFSSTLVPADLQETVFNELVDVLNEKRDQAGIHLFEIIKGDLGDVDKEWLAKQTYLSGELWSYVENSGCCQTELRIRSRISLTEPGKTAPTFEVFLPLDGFFDHDQSTLEKEKLKLARRLARELASKVITALANRK
ncbi:MAG: hypothetical protein GJT30_07715 [Geobacter sp.]|nr:hypothetical protein [Geobacter sp.]